MSSDSSPTLGEILRHEREKRGITIEQVASATKISVRLLHALEGDQYAELPAKPFVRGFVTSYARFVGLDPQELLIRFGDFIDQRAHDRPNRESGHSGYAFERREGEQSRTVLWIVMTASVVLGGVFIVVFKPALKHRRESHAERLRSAQASPSPAVSPLIQVAGPALTPSPAPAQAAPALPAVEPTPSPTAASAEAAVPAAAAPEPSATPTAAATVSATPSGKPDPLNSGLDLTASEIKQKVVIKALADVWVRYQVDQKQPMKFILRKDRLLVLRAATVISFQVSNPRSVQFNLNNRGFKQLSADKTLAQQQRGATFPFGASELLEKYVNPFEAERPLPQTPPPAPPAASQSPAPNP